MNIDFSGIWERFSNWIYENLTFTLKMMYSLITKFPKISEMTELNTIWQFVTLISVGCIGLVIVYLGFKMFVSVSSANKINIVTIFERLVYSSCFIAVNRLLIDLIIDFNNTLVDVFVNKFDLINLLNPDVYISEWVGLVAVGLAIFQLFLSVKIMIGYFLRVAEVTLMYVTTPIMCTLWINPNWSGHLNTWINRLVSLIFTQFAQVIILIIYSQLIFGFFESISIFNICLGSAFLILMNNMPSWIEKYISPDNSGKIMVNTCKSVFKKGKVTKNSLNKSKKGDEK